jgi:hypothetical protein
VDLELQVHDDLEQALTGALFYPTYRLTLKYQPLVPNWERYRKRPSGPLGHTKQSTPLRVVLGTQHPEHLVSKTLHSNREKTLHQRVA